MTERNDYFSDEVMDEMASGRSVSTPCKQMYEQIIITIMNKVKMIDHPTLKFYLLNIIYNI